MLALSSLISFVWSHFLGFHIWYYCSNFNRKCTACLLRSGYCTEAGFEGGRTESSIAVSPAMSASGIGIVAQRWEDIDGSIVLYTQSYKDLIQSKSLDNRCEVLKIRLV